MFESVRIFPLAVSVLAVVSLDASTMGTAMAATHHHAHAHAVHHAKERHSTSRHASKTRHESHESEAKVKGAMTVPAGGIKAYCAGRKQPLLVRKSTQGSGTTVTVICR